MDRVQPSYFLVIGLTGSPGFPTKMFSATPWTTELENKFFLNKEIKEFTKKVPAPVCPQEYETFSSKM